MLKRKISSSSFITVNGKRYSLPSLYIGNAVSVISLPSDRYLLELQGYCRIVSSKHSEIYLEDYQYSNGLEELEKRLLISALIGPSTKILTLWFARSRNHPLLSFQVLNGVHYLADRYGVDIVEESSTYFVDIGKSSYYLLKRMVITRATN